MDFVPHKAVSWAKKQFEARKTQIAAAGATLFTGIATFRAAVPDAFADATTDSLNDTFTMLGCMLDGFGDLVPHIVQLIVAMIPLAMIGMVLMVIFGILVAIPAYIILPRVTHHGSK